MQTFRGRCLPIGGLQSTHIQLVADFKTQEHITDQIILYNELKTQNPAERAFHIVLGRFTGGFFLSYLIYVLVVVKDQWCEKQHVPTFFQYQL